MTKKNPNYNYRLAVAGTTLLALGASATYGVNKAASAGAERVRAQHSHVEVPPAGGMYKTFHLNEQFKVGDKIVTVANLSEASQLADLQGVDSRATLEMLESQMPKGMDATEIPADLRFKLPVESEIGDLHTGD